MADLGINLIMSAERHISECPVCLDSFKNPKELTCRHSICGDCCSKLLNNRAVICPICKESCPAKKIRKDFRLEQFIEALTEKKVLHAIEREERRKAHPESACVVCENAVFYCYCVQCEQWLCKTCQTLHKRIKATEGHTFLSMSEKSSILQQELKDKFKNFGLKTIKAVNAAGETMNQSLEVWKENRRKCLSDFQEIELWCFCELGKFFKETREAICRKPDDELVAEINKVSDMQKDFAFIADVEKLEIKVNHDYILKHTKALQLMETWKNTCDAMTSKSAELCAASNADLFRLKVDKDRFLELIQNAVKLDKIDFSEKDYVELAGQRKASCTVSRNPDQNEELDRPSTSNTGSLEALGRAPPPLSSSVYRSRSRSRSPIVRLSPGSSRSESPEDIREFISPWGRSTGRQTGSSPDGIESEVPRLTTSSGSRTQATRMGSQVTHANRRRHPSPEVNRGRNSAHRQAAHLEHSSRRRSPVRASPMSAVSRPAPLPTDF